MTPRRVTQPPRAAPAAVRRWAAAELRRLGIEQSAASADVLVRHALGIDRAEVTTRSDRIGDRERVLLRTMLERRAAGEPVQLIVGTTAFRSLELRVAPGVFIPRPETELLVDHALRAIDRIRGARVIDVGTGTGAIALAIAHERPDVRVFATDRSAAAVGLARANASRLGLTASFLLGDLLGAFAERDVFDLVVSNPPYVDPGATLPPEVHADPPSAVFGEPELTARLIAQSASRLRPGGTLALEIGEDRGPDTLERLSGPFRESVVLGDLAGRPRYAIATR